MSKQAEAAARRARNARVRKNRAALKLVHNREEIESFPDRMLTLSEVTDLVGVSYKTINKLVDERRFPSPTILGPRARRWWLSEVVKAVDKLRADRKPPTPPEGPRAA
jgi:predicted DNA-binding transcriptional regulator AlpA